MPLPSATSARHLPTTHNSHPLILRQRTTMEAGQARAVAPSYLGWSIFNTLCCCLPIGIAAIVCSCRVSIFSEYISLFFLNPHLLLITLACSEIKIKKYLKVTFPLIFYNLTSIATCSLFGLKHQGKNL